MNNDSRVLCNVLYNVVKNKCCFAVSPSWLASLTHVANPKSDFSTKLIDSLDSELSPESGFFPLAYTPLQNVGQPHSHIGWDKSMPFASINPTNPRTNPWNFHKKILRIGDFEKCTFFESAILNFFFSEKNIFFAFFPWKLVKVYWLARMGQNFHQVKRDNTFWPMPNILKGSVCTTYSIGIFHKV